MVHDSERKEAKKQRRHQVKSDRLSIECQNRVYYDSIIRKPMAFVNVVSVDECSYLTDMRNSIALFAFVNLKLDQWIDFYPILGFSDKEDKAHVGLASAEDCEENTNYAHLIKFPRLESLDSRLRNYHDLDNDTSFTFLNDIGNCKWPVVFVNEKKLIISGLCSTLRFFLKFASMKAEKTLTTEVRPEISCRLEQTVIRLQGLLGFRGGCLQACAESSIWTRFCEVDMIEMVTRALVKDSQSSLKVKHERKCESPSEELETDDEIPVDLMRLEYHLAQPVRIHNFRKRVQAENQQLRHDSTSQDNLQGELISDLSHVFAEGPDMTLSDVILYSCVHLSFSLFSSSVLSQHLPRVSAWYSDVTQVLTSYIDEDRDGQTMMKLPTQNFAPLPVKKVKAVQIPCESLYKSDPSRYKAKLRLFTRQDDVEDALRFILSTDISVMEPCCGPIAFDWKQVPLLAHPEGGALPDKRRERKCHQLASLVRLIVDICTGRRSESFGSEGRPIRIVDFCSGGGHLGIILAWLLPQCQIILVENKEESLRRAEERVSQLSISNITLIQSNLDYFQGSFEVGVGLHACGSATDLIVDKCVSIGADFVVCPCCYGAIQSNHMLHYPRSRAFSRSGLSLKQYFVVGHAADQTHDEANDKTEQGKTCMRIIDTDRLLFAQEQSYDISLHKIFPETSTPKNHILVGLFKIGSLTT